jgi:hypothetical protein
MENKLLFVLPGWIPSRAQAPDDAAAAGSMDQ